MPKRPKFVCEGSSSKSSRAGCFTGTRLGQPVPSLADEDALIDAVLAESSGWVGWSRCWPAAMSRTSSSTALPKRGCGWPTDASLPARRSRRPMTSCADLIQRLGTTLGDGSTREFSDARPLLALRLKAVGDLGARLSAAMDVTPHPAGTIRVHRHVEADLDDVYRLGMIDAPLLAFLRAAVLAGLKICVVGAMGAGKTFLLRALCAEIPLDKMIVTVEDERELGLHVLPAAQRTRRDRPRRRTGRSGAASPGGAGASLRERARPTPKASARSIWPT